MARFATMATLNVNDAIPKAWLDEAKAFHDWFIVAGATLASAATINPTASYHLITGTTQINTITDSSGPSLGQPLILKIQSGVVFGTSGNIVSATGAPVYAPAGTVAEFLYDGTNWQLIPKVIGWSSEFDVVNTAALTTIFTQSIPGGVLSAVAGAAPLAALGALGALDIVVDADYLNNSGATKTLTIQIVYGATTLWGDIGTNISQSGSHRAFSLEALLSNENATSAQRLAGHAKLSGVSAGSVAGVGGGGTPDLWSFGFGGTSAEDSTAAKTLLVQVQHSAAAATVEFKGSVHVAYRP